MGTPTSAQIEEFLDKLNDDADFRYQLKHDATSVLTAYDIPHDPNGLPDPADIQLPDVGEVNANRDAFREELFPDEDMVWNDLVLTLPPSST